jgi:hypothetical protein
VAKTSVARHHSPADEGMQLVRQVSDTLTELSADAGTRVSELASGAGDVARETDRALRRSSDQTLEVIGLSSLGFAAGLLVGGSHRLFVILALVPTLLVALVAVGRLDGATRPTRRRRD